MDRVGHSRTKRPRILVIGLNYGPEQTGIAPYTSGMVEGLSDVADVHVVTTFPHYPEWKFAEGVAVKWRTDETGVGVTVSRLRHYLPSNPTGLSRILSEATFALRALVARVERPDLVIAVSPGLLPALTAQLLSKRWGVPHGVVVQDLYSSALAELNLLGGRAAKAAAKLESWILRSATGVVSIHASMADTITSKLGVAAEQVNVIPNWTHVVAPTADRMATRKTLGWGAETVVLHAGNMGAKQGLNHVVDAARHADGRDHPIRFVFLGGGSRRESLVAQGAGIDCLDFLDSIPGPDFPNVLAAADLLLLHEKPGVEEMCVPSKLTSYFAAGRPVLAVASETGAAAHEVSVSGSGLVARPGDVEGLLAAVDDLSQMDLDALGRSGQSYAQTTLSAETALDSYRAWVSSLLVSVGTPAKR